jgi:ABC-type microcin C transport system permease subunit YejB
MKDSWTRGLDPEVIKDITSNYLSSKLMRKRLIALLELKSKTNLGEMRNKISYESPSWAYLQADRMGYERALRDIIDLIED